MVEIGSKGAEKKNGGGKKVKNGEADGLDSVSEEDAAAAIYPPLKLGQFYDFFSCSHLTPPVQCKVFFFFTISKSLVEFFI